MSEGLHGLLLIKKPSGITSHDVVQKIRRSLSLKEVGHAGTLDPLAEGLMVLLIGEATKMSSYVLEEDKGYDVTIMPGVETDTLDITGTVLRESQNIASEQEIITQGLELKGDFQWEVPLFSATKVSGKKLYEHARNSSEKVDFKIPIKSMSFWDNEYLGKSPVDNHYQFRLRCSKGSFIRSWVDQLGKKLGCGAVMSGLTRTFSAPYNLSGAISLDEINQMEGKKIERIKQSPSFVPLMSALPGFKIIRVSGQSASLIRNGQISHELRRRLIVEYNPEVDQGVKILNLRPESLLAIIGFEKEKGFVVRRVFRYDSY